MSSTDPFKVLGLKPTDASEADVKRAYAKRLKHTRPDDDPEGFMELRNAFTHARNIARANDANDTNAQKTKNSIVVEPEQNTQTDQSDLAHETTPEVSEEEVKYWYDEKLNYHFDSSPYGKLVEQVVRWTKSEAPSDPDPLLSDVATAAVLRDPAMFRQFQEFLLNTIFWDSLTDEDFDDYDIEVTPSVTRPDWLTDDTILALQKHFDLLGYLPEELWQGHRINAVIAMFTPILTEHGLLAVRPRMHDTLDLFEKQETKYRSDDHGSYFDRDQKKWIDKSPVSQAMRDIADLIKANPWGALAADWQLILERNELQMIDEHRDLDSRLVHYICEETGFWSGETLPSKCSWLTKEVVLMLDDTFGWGHQFGRHMHERKQYDWLHRIIGRHRQLPKNNQGFKQQATASRPSPQPEDGSVFLFEWLFRPWPLFAVYLGIRILFALAGND